MGTGDDDMMLSGIQNGGERTKRARTKRCGYFLRYHINCVSPPLTESYWYQGTSASDKPGNLFLFFNCTISSFFMSGDRLCRDLEHTTHFLDSSLDGRIPLGEGIPFYPQFVNRKKRKNAVQYNRGGLEST
jgi:hypothetical protein